jgi:hypothetical protein
MSLSLPLAETEGSMGLVKDAAIYRVMRGGQVSGKKPSPFGGRLYTAVI